MGITREKYQHILYSEAISKGVEVRFASRVRDVDEATPSVTLTTGETIKADLLIGADGTILSSPTFHFSYLI